MKRINILLIIGIICCIVTGCSTTEKFTVTGTPGTTVYSPQKNQLGTIGPDGKLKIKVTSDAYYGYMLTYDQTSGFWVPFGLDVKTKRHSGAKATRTTGLLLECATIVPLLTGGIMALSGDGDVQSQGAMFAAVGGVAAFGGIGMHIVGHSRMAQLSYQWNFGYNETQSTNQDVVFTQYVAPITENENDVKETKSNGKTVKSSSSSTAKSSKKKSSKKKNKSSSKAKINIQKDISKVIGTYSGTGIVSSGKTTISNLDEIEIKIERRDNNMVAIQIYYDGEPMFDSWENYSVSRKKDGSYLLTHEDVEGALITILSNGRLDYRHPAIVFEDGEEYILTIKASK